MSLCAEKVFSLSDSLVWAENASFFANQKPFIRTNRSLFPPKATLFHPPPPISTPLNLLFAKNTAVLLISALNPYAVKPEHRTDSNHCRRYPEYCSFSQNRLPDECRSFQKKSRIDRRFESSPESRGSQTSGVLLVLFVHAKRINSFPSQGALRFCKSRISTPQELKPFESFEVLQTSKQHAQTPSHWQN